MERGLVKNRDQRYKEGAEFLRIPKAKDSEGVAAYKAYLQSIIDAKKE